MYLIKENARVPAPKKKEKQKQAEVVTEPVQVVEETRGLTSDIKPLA